MFATSVEQIKDFQLCERLYDYRHQEKLGEPLHGREMMAQRYENTLRRVASFFFYKRQGGLTPSLTSLLNRWERLWFPKDTSAYDIAIEQHESWHGNLASYTTAATASLMQFHEDFAGLNADPILIEETYEVPLGRDVKLNGKLDLVLRTKQKEYFTIMLSGRQKRPPMNSLLLEFAAMRYAFEYRSPPAMVKYYMYDIGSAKPGFIEAKPNEEDVRALIYWAKELSSTELFVPRRGFTSYCRSCPFDAPCSKWNEWPET